jgi:Cu+-exporting ATPase
MVNAALERFGTKISIIKHLETRLDPIVTFIYRPSPPSFTIRTIMSALASVNSPRLSVSINHPPSIEERACQMQSREQKALIHRLVFSIVCAVPTFVLGVVYMMLVPKENNIRSYLMEPMGNVSRVEWALLFLATPVMFYSAGIYHKRSFKEIGFLWRRGSTTPLLQRFTRLGSTNLLVDCVRFFCSVPTLIKGSL